MISDQELFQIAYPYIKQKKHVLLSIGIVDPSETRKICIGEAGISQVKNDCTYEIGSITKSFVASLIADLVEKERISLSDVVWKGATLKQLLTHSSAIEEYPIHNVDFPNPFSNIFTEDIKRFLEKRDLSSKHGWSYSNLGFALIGMFLEENLTVLSQKSLKSILSKI